MRRVYTQLYHLLYTSVFQIPLFTKAGNTLSMECYSTFLHNIVSSTMRPGQRFQNSSLEDGTDGNTLFYLMTLLTDTRTPTPQALPKLAFIHHFKMLNCMEYPRLRFTFSFWRSCSINKKLTLLFIRPCWRCGKFLFMAY